MKILVLPFLVILLLSINKEAEFTSTVRILSDSLGSSIEEVNTRVTISDDQVCIVEEVSYCEDYIKTIWRDRVMLETASGIYEVKKSDNEIIEVIYRPYIGTVIIYTNRRV